MKRVTPVSRRIRRRWHPKLLKLLADIESRGYYLCSHGPHVRVFTPEGKRIGTISKSPSDVRTGLNDVSDLRKYIRIHEESK